MTITEVLKEIQKNLKVPKNQYNAFGKYKYRSAEDILEAVKPLLYKYDAVLTLTDEVQQVGDRYYVIATAVIQIAEAYLRTVAYAREDEVKKGMDQAQITGAASSYARKYALNGLFCLDDGKDSDATNDGVITNDLDIEVVKKKLKEITTEGELKSYYRTMPQGNSEIVSLFSNRKKELK